MEKSVILQRLRQHLQEEQEKGKAISKRRAKLYACLKDAVEEDIGLGDCPRYFYAYMICNSTGVGTSSFKGSETQRTVALDYTTDTYLFIDGHEGAAVKGLQLFHLKSGETVRYYRKDEMEKQAERYGLNLHLQQLRDLNFTFSDHRLNRYTANITQAPFSYPIRPVFVSIMGEERPILIGYVYENKGGEHFLIDIEDPRDVAKKPAGCSPWMFLGFLFPPLLIIALIVIINRKLAD